VTERLEKQRGRGKRHFRRPCLALFQRYAKRPGAAKEHIPEIEAALQNGKRQRFAGQLPWLWNASPSLVFALMKLI